MRVGIFDSGVGGLSVLKKVVEKFPHHDYFYYADTERAPYGKKTENQILSYSIEAVEFLRQYEVDVIVIACNTATKVALSHLKDKFKDITIIGIEPPINKALSYTQSVDEKIIVFATPVTVNNLATDHRYNNFSQQIELCPITKLVTLAEQGNFNQEDTARYLREKINGIVSNNHDLSKFKCVILGCTHFPFFKETFALYFPNQKIIDGTNDILEELSPILDSGTKNLINKPSIHFFKNKTKVTPNIFKKWLEL